MPEIYFDLCSIGNENKTKVFNLFILFYSTFRGSNMKDRAWDKKYIFKNENVQKYGWVNIWHWLLGLMLWGKAFKIVFSLF